MNDEELNALIKKASTGSLTIYEQNCLGYECLKLKKELENLEEQVDLLQGDL